MRDQFRDTAATLLAVAAIAIGLTAAQSRQIDPGLTLARAADGSVVVATVRPAGTADQAMIRPGMVVEYIGARLEDGTLPPDAAPPADPLEPTPLGQYSLRAQTGEVLVMSLSDPNDGRLSMATQPVVWAIIAVLVGLWLRLRPTLVPLADPAIVRRLAVVTAAVLAIEIALVPAALSGTTIGLWSHVLLPAPGILLLVDGAASETTRRIRVPAFALAIVAAAAWLVAVTIGYPAAGTALLVAPLAALSAAFIAIAAAVVAPDPPVGTDFESRMRRGIRTFDLSLVLGAIVAGLVALALATASPGDWANVAMVWLVLVAFRLVVVPFIVTARRARSSRDSTLDAVEAERVRISGEIHDDVIQDLTMLVRRLDANADHESATLAREAAGRLREITGDARLPVLDDLGVAAALDWLVKRMSAIEGGGLTLATDEAARPPRSVEVAVFRVAQEAVANALRHGVAPVAVRYRSAADRAALEVVDAGPGIADRAEEIADGAGRLGIAGMRRRAAAIDASLRIDRPAEGGTRVRLDWGAA